MKLLRKLVACACLDDPKASNTPLAPLMVKGLGFSPTQGQPNGLQYNGRGRTGTHNEFKAPETLYRCKGEFRTVRDRLK